MLDKNIKQLLKKQHYEIAGKNEADPTSFKSALFMALDIFRARDRHKKDTANAVRKTPKPSEIPEEM